MAHSAFFFLRTGVCRHPNAGIWQLYQGNGKRCPPYIIQIMQSLTEAFRTPGTALHNLALCKAWALAGSSSSGGVTSEQARGGGWVRARSLRSHGPPRCRGPLKKAGLVT